MNLEISTKTFIENADWLREPIFEPLTASLLMLAVDYDNERKASAYAQFGLMMRYALSLRPTEEVAEEVVDPLENILREVM
jgi:hypothetical protein